MEYREKDYSEFYCALIVLLSELCQGRNYIAIEELRRFYPIDICVDIITSNEFKNMVRSAFTRIILTLWICAHPFVNEEVPSKVKDWLLVSPDNLCESSTKNMKHLGILKVLVDFVFHYFADSEIVLDYTNNG